MPEIRKHKILPFSASKINDLIMDVEKYPEFLPWCKNARIIEVISKNNIHVDLMINFKGFLKKYRSDITDLKDDKTYKIDVHAISGPFKRLYNHWRITEINDNEAEVEFYIDFEFNSKILTKIIGAIFERANEKIMSAFEKRARDVL